MKFPTDWLNSYLERKLPTSELAAALERAGVEVESITSAAPLDPKIVVGAVEELKPHPNADKLKVASVQVKDTTLQIVCGAANIAVGQRVPVALVGAVLPDGTEITTAKLRGVESNGMICSEQELGLTQNHQGIMVLAPTTAVGSQVSASISKSDVIDTTTAANRWDLNGMVWLAREVAAHSNQKTAIKPPEQLTSSATLSDVRIDAPELTDRYLLAKLSLDASRPSPSWLQQRLQAAGVRSINVVVDVTNYVMFEYGQPLHAFDAAKVALPVSVRRAAKGEKLVTLDGDTQNLDSADLLIADANGPIGLAGVMGGRNSEIEPTTTEIYLESASFHGPSLRKAAIRHGLRTDASARFERGIPVDLAPLALARAVQLLVEVAGAKLLAGPADKLQTPSTTTRIAVQAGRVGSLLGLKLTAPQIKTELTKLNFGIETDAAGLTIVPPWWRPDVQQEADVAEEVMKLIGYDRLPATLPTWAPTEIKFDQRWPNLWKAKEVLRSRGLFEVVTYSFISQEQITDLDRDPSDFLKLKNPLSIEQAYLRADLLPSLLRVAHTNRTYGRQFGLFEFSKVYHATKRGELPNEPTRLAVLVRLPSGGYKAAKAALDRLAREFNLDLTIRPGAPEAALAHPTRSALVAIGKREIGWIGQLHPNLVQQAKIGGEVGYFELDWEPFAAAARPHTYRPINRFPGVSRDLSVVLDRGTTWQEVEALLQAHHYRVAFVGDYYGSDLTAAKKVLTLRLSLSASDHTLTDAEADREVEKLVEILKKRFHADLRA